jgi:hypothetical protein
LAAGGKMMRGNVGREEGGMEEGGMEEGGMEEGGTEEGGPNAKRDVCVGVWVMASVADRYCAPVS